MAVQKFESVEDLFQAVARAHRPRGGPLPDDATHQMWLSMRKLAGLLDNKNAGPLPAAEFPRFNDAINQRRHLRLREEAEPGSVLAWLQEKNRDPKYIELALMTVKETNGGAYDPVVGSPDDKNQPGSAS